jgi:hypothetical protein
VEVSGILHLWANHSKQSFLRFHRSITRPFFSRDRVTDFDTFERHANEALKIAKARLAEGYPIDFQAGFCVYCFVDLININKTQDLAARFTLDSATEFLFSNDVHSLGAGLPYPAHPSPYAKTNPPSFINHPSNIFVHAFVTSQNIVAKRSQMGAFWPLTEMWKDAVEPYRRILDDFVQPFMDKCFSEKQNKGGSDVASGSLLDHLIEQTSGGCLRLRLIELQ